MQVPTSTFDFLKGLKSNNNRDWFEENKTAYKVSEQELKAFFETVKEGLCQTDAIEKMKVFRIYRDVRFGKDKSPYKTNRSAHWVRAGEHRRGGYYLQLEPGNSFLAGGFFQPSPSDLFRIRKEFEADDTSIRKILSEAVFREAFGGFDATYAVKTAPKGFDKNHAAMDLIRLKSFYVTRYFDDQTVLSKDFSKEVLRHFQLLRPYFDYMSEVLTTDLNGLSFL